jgi:2-dehydropantoate 2-reductase
MQMKVLVVGAGAIGGFYGALLAQQGADVSVVCRSDFEQVKQHGFTINSHSLGNWNFNPVQVLKSVDDYKESADYVLLCTKVINTLDRVKLIESAVKLETAIVFIQNGVEIEQELVDAFPDNEVISGLAFICSNRTAPGVISHQAYGRLFLGNLPNGISSKTQKLCDVFNQSSITCRATEDIVTARWQKCIWNAPFNPLSVLSDGLLTQDILQTQEAFVRQIMQEVLNVAAATGHPLPPDTIAKNIANTYDMPPYKTSMLLDFEAGRPMETDAILGNAVNAGRRKKVPCPCLESIYALMQLKELKRSQNS